ncbi:MAG: glutamate synthase, partial [Acidimicrobiaceae bacterium]
IESLGLKFDERGNIARNDSYMSSVSGVFVAGDMGRGQSLIVWAIAEGRAAAAEVDKYLMGHTDLPSPIVASAKPLN